MAAPDYNAGMPTIDLVLPFSLPPPELARDLLRQVSLPALATLLARGSLHKQQCDPYSRLLPHQQWLVAHGDPELARCGVAACAMTKLGLEPGQGTWFVVHPASLHIARDHLVLTDLRQLQLEPEESRALFEVALPLFEEEGRELVYGNESTWFLRADDWADIETSTPDAAVGHNIDIWLPRGAGERAWRKIHNEVQMMWHTLHSNYQREEAGRHRVNSLWCWNTRTAGGGTSAGAGGAANVGAGTGAGANAGGHYAQTSSVLEAFLPGAPWQTPPGLPGLIGQGGRSLVVVNSMTPAALSGDWSQWIDTMQAAEKTWFAPLLAALGSAKIDSVKLVLTDSTRVWQLHCRRWDLKKFWSQPSLAALA